LKLELVRGGASLQFGPQFGGMLNYVLKRKRKGFTFETQNTVGSYGLMSSYNAIGGTIKNSLTMHTIIREVLTVGEKTTYSVQKHTCIYRVSLH
jgi:outer membrane receptor protein involved in Fe transport